MKVDMENDNDILAQRLRSISRPSLPDGMAEKIMERIRRHERKRRACGIALIAMSCAVIVAGAVWILSYIRPESLYSVEGFFLSLDDDFRGIFGHITAFVSTGYGKLTLITAVIAIFYLFIGEAVSSRLQKKLDKDPAI